MTRQRRTHRGRSINRIERENCVRTSFLRLKTISIVDFDERHSFALAFAFAAIFWSFVSFGEKSNRAPTSTANLRHLIKPLWFWCAIIKISLSLFSFICRSFFRSLDAFVGSASECSSHFLCAILVFLFFRSPFVSIEFEMAINLRHIFTAPIDRSFRFAHQRMSFFSSDFFLVGSFLVTSLLLPSSSSFVCHSP